MSDKETNIETSNKRAIAQIPKETTELSELNVAELMEAQERKEQEEAIDFIRKIMRAVEGQPTEDDFFSGLLRVNDIRERTRLSEHDVYRHSYLRLLAKLAPELSFCNEVANMEDPYFISLDGEQRKEAILMMRAKTTGDSNQLNISLPVTNPAQIQAQQEAEAGTPKRGKGGPLSKLIPWRR